MSVSNELLQLSHVPSSVDNPLALGVALGVTAVVLGAEHLMHNRNQDKYAAAFPNPALAEQSIQNVQGETSKHRQYRLAPVVGATAGLGLLAAGYFGGLNCDNPHSDTHANTVVVADASLSEQHTADIGGNGITRYQAMMDGLKSSGYKGSLGVVTSGASNAVSIPLEKNWRQNIDNLINPSVDPNGGELANAITTATTLLPIQTVDGKKQRDGRVIIVSDSVGTSSSAAELQAAATKIEESGASVKVVVPGTSQGTYKFEGSQPIDAGADVSTFSAFGAKNVEQATSKDEVVSDIHKAIAEASTVHQEQPWQVLEGLGILALVGAAGADVYQRLRKIV